MLFGIDPSIVNVRRSRLTYGVGILNRFDPDLHPASKRVRRDGVDWCTDIFDKYVETDQPIMLGNTVVRSYTPAKKGMLSENMFYSEKQSCLPIVNSSEL